MQEINSAEGSPTHKLAKWLVKEFKSMLKLVLICSVKDTLEFTRKLLTLGNFEKDEMMVSFDVVALFSSVPAKDGLNLL